MYEHRAKAEMKIIFLFTTNHAHFNQFSYNEILPFYKYPFNVKLKKRKKENYHEHKCMDFFSH